MFLSLPDNSFDSKVTAMNIKVKVHGPMVASFFDPTAQCKDDLLLVQLPLNRALKSLMFLLSLASLPLATHVLWKYIHRGVYHCNIKVILHVYFMNAILQSLALLVVYAYMIYKSYTFYDNPCDVFLDREFYIYGHITNFFLCLTQVNLQTVLCVERLIATLCTTFYARRNCILGLILSIIALLLPVPIMYAIYGDEDFDEKLTSVLIPPNSARMSINYYCGYCILLCMVSLVMIQFLRWYNQKRSKELVGQVQPRFQTNENIATTSFISLILSLQLAVYFVDASAVIILYYTEYLFTDPVTLQTINTNLYLVPLFLICLPLLTYYNFTRIKRERKITAMEHVLIKTTGEEGTQNYQKILNEMWN